MDEMGELEELDEWGVIWVNCSAKLYYTSWLGLVWDTKTICWDSSQFTQISWDPSQVRAIPNPDHPPLRFCLTYHLFCTKKASRYNFEFRSILINESESIVLALQIIFNLSVSKNNQNFSS